MRKYLALIKGGFLEGIAYKENFLTGLLANFIQVVVFYYVWKSIFLYHTEINGYTWEIMKKYVIISFLCNSTFSFGFEMQTANSIISGNIITDLLKPLSYRSLTFFKAVGTAGMEFLITFLWCGTFLVMCNGMQNIEMWRVLLLLFSILLGMGIKFNIQYIFSMLCFYTDNAYGVVKGREVLTNFCSGALVPLALFPGFLQKIVMIMPFSGIVYIPCSIFDGIFCWQKCWEALLFQSVWNVILFAFGSILWKKASSVIALYEVKDGQIQEIFQNIPEDAGNEYKILDVLSGRFSDDDIFYIAVPGIKSGSCWNYLYKYSHSWRLVCMGNFIVIRISVIFRRMGELFLSGFLENCTDGK